MIKPGLVTTVQDQGRSGHYHLGIPPSGALDQISSRAANLLVGNAASAAVLECALMGPELRFGRDAVIAVTGAQMPVTVDGEQQPANAAVPVAAGQLVVLGFAAAGARAYLAVDGGFAVPEQLGSRATYALGGLGGHEGRPLAVGDHLPLGPQGSAPVGRTLPEELQVPLVKERELRVVRGLYDYRVEKESLERFFTEPWKVGSEADRVGYRLKGGTPLDFVPREPPFGAGDDPSNITDACYPIGSVQVPSGTEPIILHRDAVSGGGYMMVGTVVSADLDAVGQLPPNATVLLTEVTLEQALAARADHARWWARIETVLA